MYSGQFITLLFLIFTRADGSTLDNVRCSYEFKPKCYGDVNNYTIAEYNPSNLYYCASEDIPLIDDIIFGVRLDDIGGDLTDSLKIEFALPKKECGLRVALLVNPLIQNEKECEEYTFDENDINVHTTEKALCIFKNANQLVKYNDNSTSLCEDDNVELWFEYIFKGCYALRFRINSKHKKYIIRGSRFLNTTYQRTEVTEPQFSCKYETYYNPNQRQLTNFSLNASLPVDTGVLFEVGLMSPRNKDSTKGCIWNREKLIINQLIKLYPSVNESTKDCNVKLMRTANGRNVRTVWCNFQVQTTKTADYCFIYRIVENRCEKDTIWKPDKVNTPLPCTWIRTCTNVSLNKYSEMIIADKSQDANLYLLFPIIITILIILAIIGISFFWHLCIRKKEITLYVNPQNDDFLNSSCFESTDLNIIDNNEKEIDHDNLSCDDIILLYTKNSISFMALMKDFRETLAKICSCSIYDWYDEAEWNNVAKVGPVSWFTKLLNGKCRVVWIDTPITRSIVISRENDSGLNKLCKYYEIGDFRDVTFPVILELAKRNTNNVMHQYRRHFVVRFEGLESTANVNDPFLDLSPHARYCMPQHLAQLCLDLSPVKSLILKYQLEAEENLLQQRLRLVKIESVM